MPNTYFDFKEFRIDQSQSGMKVTTEGCILGAWAYAEDPKHILDIGAGTGLLSLMQAQKYPQSSIDAVELEPHAAAEATANFSQSRWSSQLHLHQASIQDFAAYSDILYDLIVCNPPFFSNSQRSANTKKASATHNGELPIDELARCISKLLSPRGAAFVLFPLSESEQFEKETNQTDLGISEELLVYDRPGKSVFRRIVKVVNQPSPTLSSKTLIIKESDGAYSNQFTELLKPYYLYL